MLKQKLTLFKTTGRLLFGMLVLTGAIWGNPISINAYSVDWSRGESIWVDLDQYQTGTATPTDLYFAGVVSIALTQGGNTYYRDTMCVDLFTEILIGNTYDSELLHPSQVTTEPLQRVSWLIDNALLPTQNPNIISDLPQADWVSSVAQGAGLQLAIWDLANNGGLNFAPGSRIQFDAQTDPGAVQWAQTYESLSIGRQTDSAFVYKNWDPNSGAPAQMLEGPMFQDQGPAPTPEPSTCVYLLTGLALVGVRFTRRLKTSGK